jgi:hypothetical protein
MNSRSRASRTTIFSLKNDSLGECAERIRDYRTTIFSCKTYMHPSHHSISRTPPGRFY